MYLDSERTQVHPTSFNEQEVLNKLKHFLPAQAPLKDFIHHNPLHEFQHTTFHEAMSRASCIFGYKVYLSLDEYRALYHSGRIREDVLHKILSDSKGKTNMLTWKEKVLSGEYDGSLTSRVGLLRSNWRRELGVNLDPFVHPILFRILCSYLDQGIAIWNFPVSPRGFLATIREIEQNSYSSFFILCISYSRNSNGEEK